MNDFASGTPPLAALAAQALGWPPDAFWAATPAELATALGPTTSVAHALSRDDLETLMERDPDASP